MVTLNSGLPELGARAVEAARRLALAPTAAKNEALVQAGELMGERALEILSANGEDLDRARSSGVPASALDRLQLDERRLDQMAAGLLAVAGLPDPVGEVVDGGLRPNGLSVRRVRVPLGVVGVIYENRPNVTADAAALCLKSGNAALLRGSSAALSSNVAIAAVLREALEKAGLPADAVLLVEDLSRAAAEEFVQLTGVIDCLIPRGGPSLVAMVREKATVPYVIDGDGNCHVYVHEAADQGMAVRIVLNAKTSRPSVCNAMESLLVDSAIAEVFLPLIGRALADKGVKMLADERALAELGGSAERATPEDFAREFLDLCCSVAVVDGLDAAIDHISRYSSGHSEAIVTQDIGAAMRFTREVDAAAVLVNASTRFVDGGELGLGAEVGISTQKLHARGPMGLRELTTVKYVIEGNGHTR